MSSYTDLLKNALSKKKGTQANRDANKQHQKAMKDLAVQFKQSQQQSHGNAPTEAIVKTSQRGG